MKFDSKSLKHLANDIHWPSIIKNIREKTEGVMSSLGVIVINGRVSGGGCCFVNIDTIEFQIFSNLFSSGTLCVIDECIPNIAEKGEDEYGSLNIYIRLGESNTWLYFNLENNDEDNDIVEEEYEGDVGLGKEKLVELGVFIAKQSGFGYLKNKTQRLDFAKSCISRLDLGGISDWDIRELAERAENYYELGVLPLLVKSLVAEGETITDIANKLGITKGKASKAMAIIVPEFILEYIS